MRRRKKRRNRIEKRNGLWYENGVKLEERDYALCFNSQHGNSIVSYITGSLYHLDSRKRPV